MRHINANSNFELAFSVHIRQWVSHIYVFLIQNRLNLAVELAAGKYYILLIVKINDRAGRPKPSLRMSLTAGFFAVYRRDLAKGSGSKPEPVYFHWETRRGQEYYKDNSSAAAFREIEAMA